MGMGMGMGMGTALVAAAAVGDGWQVSLLRDIKRVLISVNLGRDTPAKSAPAEAAAKPTRPCSCPSINTRAYSDSGRFTAFVNQQQLGEQGAMVSLWHFHACAAASRSISITCPAAWSGTVSGSAC